MARWIRAKAGPTTTVGASTSPRCRRTRSSASTKPCAGTRSAPRGSRELWRGLPDLWREVGCRDRHPRAARWGEAHAELYGLRRAVQDHRALGCRADAARGTTGTSSPGAHRRRTTTTRRLTMGFIQDAEVMLQAAEKASGAQATRLGWLVLAKGSISAAITECTKGVKSHDGAIPGQTS